MVCFAAKHSDISEDITASTNKIGIYTKDDPYFFRFYKSSQEMQAYTDMLRLQKSENKEILAYAVENNATGEKGILRLPYHANSIDASDYKIGLRFDYGKPTNQIYASNLNASFSAKAIIHTHPYNLFPSQADMIISKSLKMDSYIIGDKGYLKIDLSSPTYLQRPMFGFPKIY